ncbi:SCO5389 family protein [Kitasatospora sp. NPDC059571]|uniref:SCO5389 family protein n=1 Tax=Kitasatospora sp. NPDC059571 TaxID=3346871 RepID=UPI00369CEF42
MSLNVPTALLEKAEHGEVDDAEFVETVRTSLPFAYRTVAGLAERLREEQPEDFADHTATPTDAERAELLRAMASDAVRASLERHFGVVLAFQNCHRVAAFRPGDERGEAYRRFTSPRAQLLNQVPGLRSC